jgi:hypothetical protein
MKWLAFSYSLSAKSGSSPRVALWRRLRRLGAVASAGGVQVLPNRPECVEAFQWLAQELRQAGGEALVMYVEGFSALSDQQMVELFQAARAEEYAELNRQITEWESIISTSVEAEDRPKLQDGLSKLRRQHADIARVDYFPSVEGARVTARLAQAAQALVVMESPVVEVPMVDAALYQNRRWTTRSRPHVDRLACIWLIRRLIDPSAEVNYGTPSIPNDVTFDMQDADFGHVGNLCTFETMLRAFNLNEPALDVLAQIVHEIDLRDGLYARPETAGVDSVLAGWLAANLSDMELETHGIALFDGVHAALSLSLPAGKVSGPTAGER